MDRQTILRALEHHPVIPAVRSQQALEQALISPVAAVFLISSSILTLEETVDACRRAGKAVFVHLDLAEGLAHDETAVRWCVERLGVDGVISTRSSLLKTASELGALTVQRLFLMDSTSFDHGVRLLKANPPDMAEIMPGIAPKAIRQLCEALDSPVIAGGLITEPHEIALALQAGALAVSAVDQKLWNVTL